jgi:hypothetical protein
LAAGGEVGGQVPGLLGIVNLVANMDSHHVPVGSARNSRFDSLRVACLEQFYNTASLPTIEGSTCEMT